MILKDHQEKIIDLMIEQELLVSQVYRLFARKFPLYENSWTVMSDEEIEHAQWIESLREGAIKGRCHFDEGKTRTYTLSSFVSYLKGVIAEMDTKYDTMEKAGALARDIEKSLIEQNVFYSFRGDSEEIQKTMNRLREATINHREKLNSMCEKKLKR